MKRKAIALQVTILALAMTGMCQKNGNPVNPIGTEIKGVWKSIGGSFLLEAEDTTINLYSFTSQHCYKENNAYLKDLFNTTSKFYLNDKKDTLSVYLHDFGEQTRQLQKERKYYRLSKLPANCTALSDMQKKDPVLLFELFWLTLKENYAFSKERQLNWDQIYKDYRPKITSQATRDELFNVMGEIVTLTKDQHTKIISADGKTKQYTGVPTAILLREVFDKQDSVKDFNKFASQFFKNNYDNISNDLLKGKGKKVANGKIEWGDITPDIGYINIHSLTGFASNSLPRNQHIDTLNFYMTQIMKSFERKKAIIADIGFNFGGYDAAGLTIASYFTDRAFYAYTKYTFQNGSFYKNSDVTVTPSAKYHFTKPVYLLTTDLSRSAAESFVMQMKVLPNVKIVGTNTLGILSDMLGKSIGDYYLTLSNEKYLDAKGEAYEVKGIDADIKLTVFPKENMFNGHRDAVRKIIDIIEGR